MTGFFSAIIIAGTILMSWPGAAQNKSDDWNEIEAEMNERAARRAACRGQPDCDAESPETQRRYDEELNWRYGRTPADNQRERDRNEGNDDE